MTRGCPHLSEVVVGIGVSKIEFDVTTYAFDA